MAEKPARDVLDDDDGDEQFEEITGGDDPVESRAEEKDTGDDQPLPAGDEDIEVVLADQADEPGDEPSDADEDPAKKKPDAEEEEEVLSAGDDDTDGSTDPDDLGELDEEDRTYSRKVQDRILREKRVTRAAREEAVRAVATERQQTIAAKREVLETRKHLAEVLLINNANEIASAKAELRAAIEAGDSDKQTDLNARLAELSAAKSGLETAKRNLSTSAEAFEEEVKRLPTPQPERQQAQPSRATEEWKKRNGGWYGKPEFKAESIVVHMIDTKLAQENIYPVGTTDYFRELDRRIARQLPQLNAKRQEQIKRAQAKARSNGAPRSSAAPGGRGAGGRTLNATPAGKSRVVLTRQDVETMRAFKMDPNNKADVLEYARNKHAAERGERRA